MTYTNHVFTICCCASKQRQSCVVHKLVSDFILVAFTKLRLTILRKVGGDKITGISSSGSWIHYKTVPEGTKCYNSRKLIRPRNYLPVSMTIILFLVGIVPVRHQGRLFWEQSC